MENGSCRRRGRRDAERRTRAGVTRRGERSGQRASLGTRDAGRAFRERARRASLGYRRSRRVADDDRRPRRPTRETSMDARVVFCFPVVVESRERGRAAPSRRLRRGNARARAYLVLRAINHRRFRGHAVAHLAQVRPLMAPREFIFVVNLAIARFTEVRVVVVAVDGGVGVVAQHTRHHLGRLLDLAMIQIRPDPESTRRLALAPRDPTRREDFFLGASRERHRRCLLRSAMDRPRKRARLPTPTRPSSSFAPRRMSRLTPRVPKRASPSPAPRAPAHAAPSGVDVVTRIKRVSQAYPEWCRTPKTCCRVTRGSRTSNLTNQTAS